MGRCEHEDWDRTICDWVRCPNPATVQRLADKPIATCAECAPYYDPIDEQETPDE